MNRKKILSITSFLVCLCIASLSFSCATSRPVSKPNLIVNLESQSYEVVGRVFYRGMKHNLFGLFSWGGATYEKLYKKAMEMGADDVVSISVDYETWHIGAIYNQRTYVMSGIAIKYKKESK